MEIPCFHCGPAKKGFQITLGRVLKIIIIILFLLLLSLLLLKIILIKILIALTV